SLYKEFLEYYAIHKMDKTVPYSGIVELLEGLQNKGIKVAVASNKAHEAMAPLMERYFPTIRFIAALGNKPGAAPKPDPGIVFEIMQMAGESAGTTVYVGDSCVDMETGANAGLKKIGVLWGFRTKEELVNAGADALLEKPELTSFLDILTALTC
ncbi:MAG: HAD family hydrolase, partial [Bacteroidales bacterium]|nr:HAD family hydrolase [Bacteroidales bacterium]